MAADTDPRVDELLSAMIMLARLTEVGLAVSAILDDPAGVGAAALRAAQEQAETALAPYGLSLRYDRSSTSLQRAVSLYASNPTPTGLDAAMRKAIAKALAAADAAKAGA